MRLLQTAADKISKRLGNESWVVRGLRPAYATMLHWGGSRHGIPWKINDVPCRIDPRYRRQMARCYEPAVADFLCTHVQPGDSCINVGANLGAYVLQFAHWTGNDGRMVAVEPNPTALSALQRHVQWNGLDDRVQIVGAAVGRKSGCETFFAAGADGMSRLTTPNREIVDPISAVSVPVTTLDALAEKTDWIIMDIEGHEWAALAGARRLIQRSPNTLRIVVEFHPDSWPLFGVDRRDAEMLMRELHLHVMPLTGQSDPFAEHGVVALFREHE